MDNECKSLDFVTRQSLRQLSLYFQTCQQSACNPQLPCPLCHQRCQVRSEVPESLVSFFLVAGRRLEADTPDFGQSTSGVFSETQ
jgi:hypothetical protein